MKRASNLFCILSSLLLFAGFGCSPSRISSLEERPFGRVGDKDVKLYILKNANGMEARITNYGAILTELHVPDRDGKMADVVLGFDRLEDYLKEHPYFGSTVGRVANRIAGGKFSLDGKEYTLACNNGPNHLHGGIEGFDKKVWDAQPLRTAEGPALELHRVSPDGEEGYPGNLDVMVRYTLTEGNALKVEFEARTDEATPVNLAHHSYWNLAGHDSGDILDQVLYIAAEEYTPSGAFLIPTGEIAPVAGTPFDFTTPKAIGKDIGELPPDPAAGNPGGYDVNYVLLGGEAGATHLAARAKDPRSGRVMELWTTEPGLQFYSGNFLDGTLHGKGGCVYQKHQGFCLESQHYPDSVNKPSWPSVILRPGEVYHHLMIHRFYTE